jgi:cytidine deaminase
MQTMDLTKEDIWLIRAAKELIRKRRSKRSSVCSALQARSGKVFFGVNIDVQSSAPCSVCAEYAAIGTMVTDGEDEIKTIVAVSSHKGYSVIPPCGKCRELIGEFGNPYVIVKIDNKLKKVKLSELHPQPVT